MKKLQSTFALIAALAFALPAGIQAQETEKPAADVKADAKQLERFSGKVTAVDAGKKSFTIKDDSNVEKQITAIDATRIRKGDGTATFDAVVVGEDVQGKANVVDGRWFAVALRVGPPKGEKKADSGGE